MTQDTFCGAKVVIEDLVRRQDLNGREGILLTRCADAEGRVIVACGAQTYRLRVSNVAPQEHRIMRTLTDSQLQAFLSLCRSEYGGSDPRTMFDLFGLPAEDGGCHPVDLRDHTRPPTEDVLRCYYGSTVYEGLEEAEFKELSRHNFGAWSFGRRAGQSNNAHWHFLEGSVVRGMVYIDVTNFSEAAQATAVAVNGSGQWYPVLAVQINGVLIEVFFRCPAIGAWQSRCWRATITTFTTTITTIITTITTITTTITRPTRNASSIFTSATSTTGWTLLGPACE